MKMKKRLPVVFFAILSAACVQSVASPPGTGVEAAENVDLGQKTVAEEKEQQEDRDFVIDDKGVLVKYNGVAEVVTVPDGIVKIGKKAFYRNAIIKKVILPDSVTEIGEDGFYECSNLTIVEGGNIQKIESRGFTGSLLQEIDLSKVEEIGIGAFRKTSLQKMNLPKVKVVGQSAFESSLLEEIHFGEVEELGQEAFYLAKNLTTVTGLEHIQKVGYAAFMHTPFEKSYWEDESKGSLWIENGILLLGNHCTGKVVVPDGVTKIAGSAFCEGELEQIFLPDTVTEIEDGAFDFCRKMTTVRMEDSVTKIGRSSFNYCHALKDIRLSNSLTNIDGAFVYCYGLEQLTLPASLERLGENAFEHCKNLKTLTVPLDGLQDYADNVNLVNYTLPFAQTVYVTDLSKAGKLDGAVKKGRTTVAELELSVKKVRLGVGSKFTLRFNSKAKAEKWTSSNRKVVTVDRVGNLYAKGAGTATVTAQIYGKKYRCEVTVE